MELVARSPNCFSNQYVLSLDGRSLGEFSGRWFSEGIDIQLLGQHRLRLEKYAWLGNRFELKDAGANVLANGARTGFFKSAWELNLSGGPAHFASAGYFNTGYVATRDGVTIAKVDKVGLCEGGWTVSGSQTMDRTDLVFIGLIYHTILERRRSSD